MWFQFVWITVTLKSLGVSIITRTKTRNSEECTGIWMWSELKKITAKLTVHRIFVKITYEKCLLSREACLFLFTQYTYFRKIKRYKSYKIYYSHNKLCKDCKFFIHDYDRNKTNKNRYNEGCFFQILLRIPAGFHQFHYPNLLPHITEKYESPFNIYDFLRYHKRCTHIKVTCFLNIPC